MKCISAILLVLFPLTLFAEQAVEESYPEGYKAGKQAANANEHFEYAAYGCMGGTLLGCLGGGLVWLTASGDNPKYVPEGSAEFRRGYVDGYKDVSKSKKQGSAVLGGLVGMLVSGAIVIIVLSNSSEENR